LQTFAKHGTPGGTFHARRGGARPALSGAKGESSVFGNALKKVTRSRVVWVSAAVVTGIAVVSTGVAVAAPIGTAATTFNVKTFGAKGDGKANDAGAINKAVTAASGASGGGIVQFPSGTYKVGATIHLKSNVTIQVDSGYDAAESNPNDKFQDFGHSHFHNAMFFGDRLSNIGFTGSGVIDGGGSFITGNPKNGQADKLISLTRCKGLVLSGITLRRGGHFAALINGCDNVTSNNLRIDTASDRDGWNIISTTNIKISGANIAANDDALVFKSDYALGAKLPNGHVTVTNSKLSAGCCNALMFGSETCGDFTDYNFSGITITGANKSGLGMVSMDGANISDVHYRDITVSNVASPIMQKIGTRKRCGNNPGVGHISNITYDNITIKGKSSPQFSATLWGEAGGNRISNVSFNNVKITVPGGHGSMGTGVPSNDPKDYNPKSIGTRPAYGWYIHNANNITFTNSGVDFGSGDARPAVIANAGSNLKFTGFSAEKSTGANDVVMQNVSGYCVTPTSLRVSATGSTKAC
jgi:polygalacturonase